MQRSTFGPYRVIRLLGQGGMGAVYEATGPGGEHVAVKTLPVHLTENCNSEEYLFALRIHLLAIVRNSGGYRRNITSRNSRRVFRTNSGLVISV